MFLNDFLKIFYLNIEDSIRGNIEVIIFIIFFKVIA